VLSGGSWTIEICAASDAGIICKRREYMGMLDIAGISDIFSHLRLLPNTLKRQGFTSWGCFFATHLRYSFYLLYATE
jgi:hypothetical protein